MKIGMTGLTLGHGLLFVYRFMLHRKMAAVTLDFVLGDVLVVHQVGVVKLVKPLTLPVAGITTLARHRAVADHHLAMTFEAVNLIFHDMDMIVFRRFFLAGTGGRRLVTDSAPGEVFPVFIELKMAKDTARFGDRHMFALHDL